MGASKKKKAGETHRNALCFEGGGRTRDDSWTDTTKGETLVNSLRKLKKGMGFIMGGSTEARKVYRRSEKGNGGFDQLMRSIATTRVAASTFHQP